MLVYKDLITMVDIKRVVLPSEEAKVGIELSYQKVVNAIVWIPKWENWEP